MTEKAPFKKWGYRKGDAQIFDVEADGKLPAGWYESPADVPKDKPTTQKKAKDKPSPQKEAE